MQDKKPEIMERLGRVGVTGLKTIVMTNWKGRRYNFVPEIELTLDLDKERKGVHMSRLVESITECIEEEVEIRHGSLEEIEKNILEKLKGKHSFNHAEITMKTELVVPKKTPVTGKTTMETYGVEVTVSSDKGVYTKRLLVEVFGNTVCPHAMNKCEGKTHIQRAIGILEIETDYGNEIDLEDMIECVEDAFPSRVYTILKAEDEKQVVREMYENPRFVEDVTRGILNNAKKRFKNVKIRVKTISEESIHRHNVIAEGSCRV
ncbi:MAG: GTP cyclohydrolase I FolE2 [Candidatus Altiarchaeota archaeon]|nr:GTP cyclohydrolase I FolE2 [Candidatus Altiarchaeota archaeon]